jgi:hypothetical protein
MINRLFALVVALAVASAPVALEVCQLTCGSKGMQASMPHSAHAHHHSPAEHAACHEDSGTPTQLAPVDGLCDHGTDATPSLVAARNYITAVSLLAVVPSFDSIRLAPRRGAISVSDAAWSDRLEIALAIPLRV